MSDRLEGLEYALERLEIAYKSLPSHVLDSPVSHRDLLTVITLMRELSMYVSRDEGRSAE
jgi:hypothetical protein